MPPGDLADPNISWKVKAAHWIFNQGPSTILLILILYGIHINVPTALKQINQGYEANAVKLERSAELYEKNTNQLMEHIIKDRDFLKDLLREKSSDSSD